MAKQRTTLSPKFNIEDAFYVIFRMPDGKPFAMEKLAVTAILLDKEIGMAYECLRVNKSFESFVSRFPETECLTLDEAVEVFKKAEKS